MRRVDDFAHCPQLREGSRTPPSLEVPLPKPSYDYRHFGFLIVSVTVVAGRRVASLGFTNRPVRASRTTVLDVDLLAMLSLLIEVPELILVVRWVPYSLSGNTLPTTRQRARAYGHARARDVSPTSRARFSSLHPLVLCAQVVLLAVVEEALSLKSPNHNTRMNALRLRERADARSPKITNSDEVSVGRWRNERIPREFVGFFLLPCQIEVFDRPAVFVHEDRSLSVPQEMPDLME